MCVFYHLQEAETIGWHLSFAWKNSSLHTEQEDVELEWLRQTEVVYYRLERSHSNALPQLKHNPWSLRCQQQHLQKMKENAKHRNQYSILSQQLFIFIANSVPHCIGQLFEVIERCGLLDSSCRIYFTGKPDMAAYNALRFRPEDGHAAAWRRCDWGKESREDPQVSAKHRIHDWGLPVRHAGRARCHGRHLCLYALKK